MRSTDAAADDGASFSGRRSALLLVALCVPLFLIGLGRYDLDGKAEPREGLTAWEMIHSGNWMLPVLNGQQLPEKPLMFPWLVALATLALGEANEWAVRLPAALSAVATVLVVCALGRRLLGPRGGFLAACVFASTFLAVSLGRRARVDMTLTFFATTAIWLIVEDFLDSEERPGEPARKGRLALVWLSMALGTLTKGPLGAILPGLAVFALLVARWRWGYLKRLFAWWGVALYAVVAGSWYAYGLAASGDDFAYRSFLMENFMMFFGEEGGGGHQHEVTFFVSNYFVHGLPWSCVFPAAVAWVFRRGGAPWARQALAIPLLWFVAMFVFFSAAAGKRADYLMPLLPAAALVVAGLWDDAPRAFADRVVRPMTIAGTGLLAAAGVAAAVLGTAALAIPPESWPARVSRALTKPDTRDFVAALVSQPVWLAAGGLSALTVFVAPFAHVFAARPRRAVLVVAAATAVVACAASLTVMPAIAAKNSLKPFAREIERVVPPGATIRNYADFQSGIFFYLARRVPVIRTGPGSGDLDAFLAEPGEGWLLTDEESWTALAAHHRDRLELALRSERGEQDATDTPVLVRRK